MGNIDDKMIIEFGVAGEMIIGGGNRNTRRKPAPVYITEPAVVGSRRIAVRTMQRPQSP
jgi:hypothetical protein